MPNGHTPNGAAAGVPAPGGNSLDAFASLPAVADALESLHRAAPDASAFLQPNDNISDSARRAAKALFSVLADEFAASAARSSRVGAGAGESKDAAALPLTTLHVDRHFDCEQVRADVALHLSSEPCIHRSDAHTGTCNSFLDA